VTTVVLSLFGFVFWIIVTHLFTDEAIGIATALMAVAGTISLLALLGFDTVLVRFLENSERKNDTLNTGITLVGLASLTLSLLFIVGISFISTELLFLHTHPFYGLIFVLLCVFSALSSLIEAIFLAHRRTEYTLYISMLFTIVKLLLPFLFFSLGGDRHPFCCSHNSTT
jgi:O-antigen/teichoic acid export membrane protein